MRVLVLFFIVRGRSTITLQPRTNAHESTEIFFWKARPDAFGGPEGFSHFIINF